ncbi:MAG: LysM peptidoglycan-binding domain-containing protein [Chloroflexi bacterium]|nr:LysM peptidoglycan-binding domain-containing protein [Chloroflexota bacterium]
MVQQTNWLRAGNPLIYVGIVVLTFFIGTLFGLLILRWWLWPSAPAVANVRFVTATAGSPVLGPMATTPACTAMPADWAPYTVQAGDTLLELAARIGINQNRLLRANCLTSPDLLAGQTLYLPLPPTPTPCLPLLPSNWGAYTVQAGDTLFDLAAARGITPDRVIQVNCLASPDILEGQQIYLPVLATPTPCVPAVPSGWDLYTVQTGDTLFSLAAARD